MEDYWGQKNGGSADSGAVVNTTSTKDAGAVNTNSGDVDMDEIQ
jgi:hypothetical protein